MKPTFLLIGDWKAAPGPTLSRRLREVPKAALLTAGYYASRVPVLSGIVRSWN